MPASSRTKTKQQLATEVMASVARLTKERMRQSGVALRPYDLTAQQVWLLSELPEHDGVPVGVLAEALQCHGSNITGMVDRLEARGLVRRHSSTTDRRVKLVALTPAGHALRARVELIAQRPPGELLDRLSADELRLLNDLLAQACGPD